MLQILITGPLVFMLVVPIFAFSDAATVNLSHTFLVYEGRPAAHIPETESPSRVPLSALIGPSYQT